MTETNRRDFLAAGAVGAAALLSPGGVFAAAEGTIKIGVIGCGGRGTGAAENTLDGNPDVQITAIGDVFPGQTQNFLKNLKRRKTADRVTVTPETTFVGLDAFQKVIDSGVDLVILATPPGFRPIHLEAAVKAGKHIFTEKPVAVDATGIRKVLALVEESKKKDLSIVAGTQRRHQKGYIETIGKLHNDKAIGDILAGRVYWNNTNDIWFRRREKNMSDTEYQVHNWYHFCWLCGDHIVEQHVHNLDVANWVMGAHPVRCVGMGGRVKPCQDPNVQGNKFDHFAVEYEYPGGIIVQSYCRQIDNCSPGNVSETFIGSKGTCHMHDGGWDINGADSTTDRGMRPYVQEHIDLINSIKSGKRLNDLKQVAESTMTAIMGRMATYTGHGLTWDKAIKSSESLMPTSLDWNGKLEAAPVPYPGKTKIG